MCKNCTLDCIGKNMKPYPIFFDNDSFSKTIFRKPHDPYFPVCIYPENVLKKDILNCLYDDSIHNDQCRETKHMQNEGTKL